MKNKTLIQYITILTVIILALNLCSTVSFFVNDTAGSNQNAFITANSSDSSYIVSANVRKDNSKMLNRTLWLSYGLIAISLFAVTVRLKKKLSRQTDFDIRDRIEINKLSYYHSGIYKSVPSST